MLADQIDALLPQTQCTRCGYAGCRPYAEAIESGAAEINQCQPGGAQTIGALAVLLHRDARPLNPENGIERPPWVAVIDESRCIGCAKCLPPCPVDAIVGAPRRMHTVVAELCTGCELCVAPCPVDCITMIPSAAARIPEPVLNRERFEAHKARAERRQQERIALLNSRKESARPQGSTAEQVRRHVSATSAAQRGGHAAPNAGPASAAPQSCTTETFAETS